MKRKWKIISRENLLFYLRFLFFKFLSGASFSLAVLIFYSGDALPKYYLLFIVQEFYLSCFFVIQKNKFINSRKNCFEVAPILFLSLTVLVAIQYVLGFSPEKTLTFFLSLIVFPVYLAVSAVSEKRDINAWVKIENFVAPISGFILFFLMAIDSIFSDPIWEGWIFCRFFMLQLGLIFMFQVRNRSWNGVVWGSINTCVPMLFDFFFVAVLMAFKINYFHLISVGAATNSEAGAAIKIFMISYDIFAAICGLYLRRMVSASKGLHRDQAFAIFRLTSILMLSVSALFIFSEGSFLTRALQLLVFAQLAILFSVVGISNAKPKLLYAMFAIGIMFVHERIGGDIGLILISMASVAFSRNILHEASQ